MYLEEIEKNVSLENTEFECKARLNRDKPIGWLKTIAGFSNATGGKFYIGVEDKTNKLIGFDRKEADNERNYFNNQINEHIAPRPEIKLNFIKYTVRNSERYIIRVDVEESDKKPVIVNYQGIPGIYMRRDGFTNGASYEEIHDMAISSANVQYDQVTSSVAFRSDDFQKLKALFSQRNDGKELTDKKMQSIGMFEKDNMLKNGAVFFMDDYDGQKTTVHCSVFSGLNRGSDRVVTLNRYQGNLIDVMNFALEFVMQRMNHGFVKTPAGRIDIPSFPQRAVLEGIVNAIAHRDYFIDGTQVQVDIFKDRLEIISPGGFYKGDKNGKTYDLNGIASKRRNELISNIFVSCKLMEAAGTGFEKIKEAYQEADDMHRPYIIYGTDHFTLVLPDLTYEEGVIDTSYPQVMFVPAKNGSSKDAKILSYCYEKARTASDIAKYLHLSDSSYFRKHILDNLVDNGYLQTDKVSRTKYYKTNRDNVRTA